MFTNSSADDRGEPLDEEEEEEDHTYELLLTAQTKVPPHSQESQSSKGKSEYSHEYSPRQVFLYFHCSTCTSPLPAAAITAEWLQTAGSFPQNALQNPILTPSDPSEYIPSASSPADPPLKCPQRVIGLNGIKLGGPFKSEAVDVKCFTRVPPGSAPHTELSG